MTSDALPEAAETYLRDLRAALSDMSAGTVTEIVDEIRAPRTARGTAVRPAAPAAPGGRPSGGPAGDRPRAVVTVAGHDIEIDLTSLIQR